jgi:hypothetical protein
MNLHSTYGRKAGRKEEKAPRSRRGSDGRLSSRTIVRNTITRHGQQYLSLANEVCSLTAAQDSQGRKGQEIASWSSGQRTQIKTEWARGGGRSTATTITCQKLFRQTLRGHGTAILSILVPKYRPQEAYATSNMWVAWQGHSPQIWLRVLCDSDHWVIALQTAGPSFRQRGRSTETRPQLSDSNVPTGTSYRVGSTPRRYWPTGRQS